MKKFLLSLFVFVLLALRVDAQEIVKIEKDYFSMEMVKVQGGEFTMGCTGEQGLDCTEKEMPSHKVTLSDYQIGKFEVTVAQFAEFIKATGYKTDARKQGKGWVWDGKKWVEKANVDWNCNISGEKYQSTENLNVPVVFVSWNDAMEFCRWLSNLTGKRFNLPTEAQWEFAARGGNLSKGYKYSGSNKLNEVAWTKVNSGNKLHEVGLKKANELGIFDMSGNVWEWCFDWFGKYTKDAAVNPKGSTPNTTHTQRGGSWDSETKTVRVSTRESGIQPEGYNIFLGFRVVCNE